MASILDAIRSVFRKLFGGGDSTPPSNPKIQQLVCVNEREVRDTVTIGKEGGTLRIGRHSLVIPPDAVEGEVRFTGTLLPDKVLKLDLRANGEEKYSFRTSALLTLSYAHCEQPKEPERLRIYKIDEKGNIIEDMGGEVNVKEQTVTAKLRGLSLYTMGLPW
jgi:hypothetical protein